MEAHDEIVAMQIASMLEPLVGPPEYEGDLAGQHTRVRAVVREALRQVGTYDAYACPLCLS